MRLDFWLCNFSQPISSLFLRGFSDCKSAFNKSSGFQLRALGLLKYICVSKYCVSWQLCDSPRGVGPLYGLAYLRSPRTFFHFILCQPSCDEYFRLFRTTIDGDLVWHRDYYGDNGHTHFSTSPAYCILARLSTERKPSFPFWFSSL